MKTTNLDPSWAEAAAQETQAAVYTGREGAISPLTTERTCSGFSEDTKDSSLPGVAAYHCCKGAPCTGSSCVLRSATANSEGEQSETMSKLSSSKVAMSRDVKRGGKKGWCQTREPSKVCLAGGLPPIRNVYAGSSTHGKLCRMTPRTLSEKAEAPTAQAVQLPQAGTAEELREPSAQEPWCSCIVPRTALS